MPQQETTTRNTKKFEYRHQIKQIIESYNPSMNTLRFFLYDFVISILLVLCTWTMQGVSARTNNTGNVKNAIRPATQNSHV